MTIGTVDMNAAATRVSQSLAAKSGAQGLSMAKASAAAATTGSTTSAAATAGAGDISSNDFLTLLVTEMKNQDPTQPTDPNAYIQQLVGVNSLQQLIAINQDLTTPAAPTGTGSGSSVAATPSISNF